MCKPFKTNQSGNRRMLLFGLCSLLLLTCSVNVSGHENDSKVKGESGHFYPKSQQHITVRGLVTDASTGESLPGVSVIVKGTTVGTTTDFQGSYSIDVTGPSDILVFSFIGYTTSEALVGSQTSISIALEASLTELDEVVVVGYGIQKKINLTGAVSSVRMDDLENRPITSASTALQGKVPGVYALQVSGKPGDDNAIIDIRGVGTLGNSDPLILIDGLPGNLNDVNARDIGSISVLKDASSAAIYGNRAANGVILITTKRGTNKKMSFSYTGYGGVQRATFLPEVFNSVEYATLLNEANTNSGMRARYTEEEIQSFADGDNWRYPNINYFDVYYDPARIQNHHFNLSGGADNLHYAFMLGYLDQDGILVGTKYNRFDFRSNLDAYYLKDDRLRLSTRISGNRGTRNEPLNEWGAKWYALNAPVWPLQNEDGDWIAVAGEQNHYGEIKEGSTTRILRSTFSGQVEAEYKIFDGLSAQVTYGYNLVESNSNAFNANVTLYTMDGVRKDDPSSLSVRDDHNTQTLLTSLLRYEKTVGKHELNLLAGYSEEEFNWAWSSAFRRNFIGNNQRILNLGDPATMENNAGAWDLGLKSIFGRVNYIFNSRYLFEANVRRDGSSRFGEGQKWGTFPSFSAGWIISEEAFLENALWLSSLKLRASWGQLGNQNINSHYAASDILFTGHNYPLGGTLQSGVAITSMSNVLTTWETAEQINVGVDMVINRNIDITLDYFKKNTFDILMQVPIPLTMGDLNPPHSNVGAVENLGLEFATTYRKAFTSDLNFRATFFVAYIKNKITDLHGRSPIIYDRTAHIEGYAINSFYGYKVDGIYQVSDFTWQQDSNPEIPHEQRAYVLREGVTSVANYTAQPGDLKFLDLTNDGDVTMEDDRAIIGKQFPDWSFSLQLNSQWKQFDMGLFLQGVYGIEGYTYYEISMPFSGTANTGAWWNNRWTYENPSEEMPRLTRTAARNHIHSEFYMEDASYLRLKNVELGYTLKEKVSLLAGISSLRVYANVQNAFTLTNFKGFDPEQPIWETRAHAYPQVRIVTMGVNINF